MSNSSFREMKREAKAAKIHVNPTMFNDAESRDVPQTQREIFRHIQNLGGRQYSTYAPEPSLEKCSDPWQMERKKKARLILDSAVKCKAEMLNEAGWRNAIEPRLFDRFDIEVAWLVLLSSLNSD
jgi:hypothetical protein